MISLLSRWRRPRVEDDLSHLTVTVYTRAECCCCHKAIALLKDDQRRHGFVLDEVDVDADPELRTLYDTDVPVVAVNGKVRFRGVVNRVLWDRLLEAERRGG